MVASLIITIRKIILMMMKKNKNQLHIMNLGHILNIKIYLIDLFNSLLKLKIEREKEIDGDESESNKIINNNIFINNNLNLNLFNNNKHKIISRNAQVNNYENNDNIFENSNTFISNLSKEQLNKTALLPSTKNIQNKIDNYAQKLEMNKILINDMVWLN